MTNKCLNIIFLIAWAMLFYFTERALRDPQLRYLLIVAGLLALMIGAGAMNFLLLRFFSKDNLEACVAFSPITLTDKILIIAFVSSFAAIGFTAPNIPMLLIETGLILVLTSIMRYPYWGAIYLCFGYRLYRVTTRKKGIYVFYHRKIRTKEDIPSEGLRRINDTTFIERKDARATRATKTQIRELP